MFQTTAQLKGFFFDRQAVISAITRGERKVLSKQGAFLRGSFRRALRRRKKPSSPGQYPHVHSNDRYASLKNTLFAYDPPRHSVYVGPVRINTKHNVPELLTHGGTIRKKNGKTVHIRKRKMIKDKYEEVKDKLNSMWKDSIR